jgi:hypothetical protein
MSGGVLVRCSVFNEFEDGGGDKNVTFDTNAFPAIVNFRLSFCGFDVGGDVDTRFDGDDEPL